MLLQQGCLLSWQLVIFLPSQLLRCGDEGSCADLLLETLGGVWWAISPWKIRASPGFRMMGITYVPIRRFADIPIADNCCMPQCQPILITNRCHQYKLSNRQRTKNHHTSHPLESHSHHQHWVGPPSHSLYRGQLKHHVCRTLSHVNPEGDACCAASQRMK